MMRATKSTHLDVVNPANGKVVRSNIPVDTAQTIKSKVKNAVTAQKQWRDTSLRQREQIVSKFASLLQERTDDLAATLTSEVGKPITQAKNEVKGTQARLKFFLSETSKTIAPRIQREGEEVRYEPLGTIANVSAWNYPYFVGVNVFAPALLTGNAVLYKPSEYATLTGMKIIETMHEAGLPKDLFVPVIGRGDVGHELVTQPELNGVYFTGSNATGEKIAQAVGGRMIRLQMELGGKDPAYVKEDVDIAKTAAALADGAMYNAGQSCCSVERIYVHQSIAKDFIAAFVEEVKKFKVGDPTDPSTYIGPLTLPHQPAFLRKQLEDAVSKGAKVLVGAENLNGANSDKPGNWFNPTVLTNVNHTMDVMVWESFGPIIGIQEVKNDEEAVQLMNDTKYGLTAAVYTQSKQAAENILSRINSGTVYWNACDRLSPYLPWSGRKGSGIGSTLGIEGIQAFVQPKAWHFINP